MTKSKNRNSILTSRAKHAHCREEYSVACAFRGIIFRSTIHETFNLNTYNAYRITPDTCTMKCNMERTMALNGVDGRSRHPTPKNSTSYTMDIVAIEMILRVQSTTFKSVQIFLSTAGQQASTSSTYTCCSSILPYFVIITIQASLVPGDSTERTRHFAGLNWDRRIIIYLPPTSTSNEYRGNQCAGGAAGTAREIFQRTYFYLLMTCEY